MSQSPVRPLTQFSYRLPMWAGTKSSASPRASSASRSSASLPPLAMYHWRLVTISSGRSPFSKNFTGWVMGSGSPSIAPASSSISTMRCWAANTVLPAISAYAARASLGLDALRAPREQAAVPAEDGAGGELELAPPGHVGGVAERADHRDAGALVGAREVVRHHGHLDAEQRRAHVLAEEAAGSARRRGAPRARRTRAAARGAWSR